MVTAVNRWLAALRIMHPTACLVRAVIFVAGAAALVVLGSMPWDVADLTWAFAFPLLLVSTTLPDSAAPLCLIGVVGLDWMVESGGGGPGWQAVLCALLLLVVHLTAAYAGQVPSYAASSPAAARRWLLPATVAAGVAVLAAALSTAADGRPGSLVLTCAALIAIALLAWFVGAAA